jgi:hypothetical protein
MKTTLSLRMLLMLGILFARNLSAGPLANKHLADQSSAVAGALAAQQIMRPFNPSGPIIDRYYRQYANEGFVRKPLTPTQMAFLKTRLVWEYGPLSAKAFTHVQNLNDAVLSFARENPSLLNSPAELTEEITRKIRNLSNRETTFKGLQAETSEARHRGWWLTKRNDSQTFDLYDPKTRSSFQMKVYKNASDSLKGLKGDYADFASKHPDKARFYNGMMPENQINELVAAGKLTKSSAPMNVGTQNGIEKQVVYLDPDTGFKIIAAKSEPTAKQFQENVRKGYALQDRLSRRPAGFGNAMAGGFVVGSGVSILFQTYHGEDVNWTSVAQSGGIGLVSSAATVILAQQIEQRFGKQLAESFIAKNLFPGLARGSLSGAAASTGVGAVVVLGFVAKDYFTDQITANEALIQSGIGLGSVGAGVGAGVIATWATAGTVLGSEVPIIGNAAGFVVGLVGGAAVYLGGNWYYENFKLDGIRAEMVAFKHASSKWEAAKMEKEMSNLREIASTLRAQAAAAFHR